MKRKKHRPFGSYWFEPSQSESTVGLGYAASLREDRSALTLGYFCAASLREDGTALARRSTAQPVRGVRVLTWSYTCAPLLAAGVLEEYADYRYFKAEVGGYWTGRDIAVSMARCYATRMAYDAWDQPIIVPPTLLQKARVAYESRRASGRDGHVTIEAGGTLRV